jgi:pimeloyl-ACP methyl ester carboxylesterase
MIVDHPVVHARAFHPRPSDRSPDLVVDVGEAVLGCHVIAPYADAGYVLYFHGNGERAADYVEHWPDLFASMGVNVCFAEYRGYGQSTGSPNLTTMRGDGERIVRALGVDPSRIVVFGRSLGSLFAVELVHRLPTLAGLIVESGIANLGEQWPLTDELAAAGVSPDDWQRASLEAFDQQFKLSRYPGPGLILHAENDRLVPFSHGERLYDWLRGPLRRLAIFPNGNHNTILVANYPDYLREVRAFLRRVGVQGEAGVHGEPPT